MTEEQKKAGVIVVTVVAVAVAGYAIYNSISTLNPKEEVVGTLDMGPKGGRDAEKASGESPSGMPKEMEGSGEPSKG